jgi:predicted XRE-type DNA-binding protein
MYSVESVADVEVRKEQNPQGPWVKKALILALISYLVTKKLSQAAIITVVFIIAMFFLR